MKFLLYADFHYNPGVFYKGDVEGMKQIQRHAEQEKVDFILHAGDLTHGPSKVKDFVSMVTDFHIPTYNCLGNHDADGTPIDEVLQLYHMPSNYYYFDDYGYRIIVLDNNYYFTGSEYVQYSLGNYFAHPSEREYIPPEELEWLREALDSSPYHCILISHASLERPYSVQNSDKVRSVINNANAKNKNRVLMCINGHHHRDFIRILDNVIYFDVNSASYDWVGIPHDRYPKEFCEKYSSANMTVMFNDPLHAIVTVEGTTIDIKGMESSMFMGINREQIGAPLYDAAARAVVPKVQSAHITLG